MIRKIYGKNQSTSLKHLIKYNTQVTNIKDIANTLAETSANSSSRNSNTEFQTQRQERKTESYNELFSLSELREAIQKSHNTAVGPDEIHHEFQR